MKRSIHLKRLFATFNGLNHRERLLVGAAAVGALLYVLSVPVFALQDHISTTEVAIANRSKQLSRIDQKIRSYRQLDGRLKRLQVTFEQSQMTFEQVTNELDKIVRESIGSDNYDLKKNRDPAPFGTQFEKQDFTLNIRSLTLDQMVKLLYQVEQGKSPLFLGKVDIVKAGRDAQFTATLEIFSIRKKTQAA